MAAQGNVVHKQMPGWREQMDLEMAENFAALVELGLPPKAAEKIAQRITQRNAQAGIAASGGAGAQPRVPASSSTGAPQFSARLTPSAEQKEHVEQQQQQQGLEPPNRLAPLPREFERVAGLAGHGDLFIRGALDRAEDQSKAAAQEFPQRRADYMNPYIQDVVDKIREEGLRTLNEGVLPSLSAQFIRRGAHGGSKHADLAQKMARDVQSEILARQTRARHSGYEQAGQLFGNDQLRKLQHGQDIRNIAGLKQATHLADMASLMDVGRYRQSHEQHGRENEYYNFMRKKNEPLDLLERQGAFMARMPAPVSQFGIQSPSNPQLGLNTAGQLGSAAAQILGMTMKKRGGPVRGTKRRRIR